MTVALIISLIALAATLYDNWRLAEQARRADRAASVADSQMHAAWEENKRLKQCLKALETRRVDDSLARVNTALNNRKNPKP